MVDLYIQFIFGIISTYGIIILNFTIFKVPIKGNDKQISILALVVGVANVYLKFVVKSDLFLVEQTIVYIIILTLLRRYPLIYSAIVCVIGSFAAAAVDTLVTYTALSLKLTTMDGATNNTRVFIILHLSVTVVYLLLSWILFKYKIGFSFVRSRFIGKYSLNPSTFYWAILLVLGTYTLQFTSQKFSTFSIKGLMVLGVALVLIVSVVYGYYQNKKSLEDRYGKKEMRNK